MESIKVFAPATVANVACGFDILGFAINEPGDEVLVRLSKEPGVRITKIEGDNGKLPLNAEQNTAGVSALKFLEFINSKQGVEIEIKKKMPLGSGLGSSAASSVAGIVAINELMGRPFEKKDLLQFAIEGERIACGSAHADNAAPALLGGFVIIRSYKPLDVIKINTPENLFATIIHPHIEIKTSDARKILKIDIPFSDAIIQWGNVAGLVAGLMSSDYALIGRSLNDVIVEPIRSILIPGFVESKKAATDAGALGFSISGSGPSLFALSNSEEIAKNVGIAVEEVFHSLKIECEVYISKINQDGPKIL